MHEHHARALADVIGGEVWLTRGGVWIVGLQRGDGRVVAISNEEIREYADDNAYENGVSASTILLDAPDDSGTRWVAVDGKGLVYFRNAELRLGWRHREEAQAFADGARSRGDGHFMIREQEADDV